MRLYDTAWVRLEGEDGAAVQAFKNARNPALFDVAGFQYDIDGRAAPGTAAPALSALLSLSEAKALGLSISYDRDIKRPAGGRMK